MKNLKKLASLLLALVIVLSLATTAFAAEITIKGSSTVPVAGKTFKAYKILDLQMVGTDGYVYTVPEALKDFYATKFSIEKTAGDFDAQVAGKIGEMQNDSDALFAFAADALKAAKDAGITPVSATGTAGAATVTITGLEQGYYVIEDEGTATPISALMLDTATDKVEVTIKADKPDVDKKIDGNKDTDDSTTGKVEENNEAIGDKVPYEVTSKVPDMRGYEKYYFVLNDTLSKGLTFNNDVVITIGDKTLVKDTDYTVTSTVNADGTTSVEIVFKNFIQYKNQPGAAITVTYSATINENAVIGVAGNPNKVTLTYSHNPNTKDDGDPDNPDKPTPESPVGTTPEKETRTYVTEIELTKVDDNKNVLAGAEFKISGTKLNTVLVTSQQFVEDANGTYYKLKDGTYTTTAPTIADDETDNSDLYESTTIKYKLDTVKETVTKTEIVDYTVTTGPDGKIKFTGLAAGTYTITEIKAPNGYNLLKAPITVTIGWTAPADESTNCTWTYKWNDGEAGSTNSIEVVNQAGSELPSTGGMGTTLFYVIGGMLTLGAAVLLITKRRMNAR